MPELADDSFDALALYVAKLREHEEGCLLRVLSAYAGAAAVALALLAAYFSPFGHPVVVFLATAPALCMVAGLGVAEYVLRCGGEAASMNIRAKERS